MRHTTEGAAPGRSAARSAVSPSRLRWFTGRFITARDLTDEQQYHLDRHRLHNRLLHGWGVVCGLDVHAHERADCHHEWVWVDPGIAIDCLGREIVLPKREAVRWPVDPDLTSDEDVLAVLCLCYEECVTEPLPALVDDCSHGTSTQPGRIVERWRLEVHRVDPDADDPWTALVRSGQHPGGKDGRPCDDCDDCDEWDDCDRRCGNGCLTPRCELGECVPLALLSRCRDQAIEVVTEREGVRPGVRRTLPTPTTNLTHVVDTSWEHGGSITIDQLLQDEGKLKVTFDRALAGGDQDRVGVNQFTFQVEIEDSTGSRERLPIDDKNPPRVDDGCVAVFTIDPRLMKRGTLVGDTVLVTLNGDLIHDCHGLPVDADFFGTFPTGDGVRGGVLRSWFFVTDGEETRS